MRLRIPMKIATWRVLSKLQPQWNRFITTNEKKVVLKSMYIGICYRANGFTEHISSMKICINFNERARAMVQPRIGFLVVWIVALFVFKVKWKLKLQFRIHFNAWQFFDFLGRAPINVCSVHLHLHFPIMTAESFRVRSLSFFFITKMCHYRKILQLAKKNGTLSNTFLHTRINEMNSK